MGESHVVGFRARYMNSGCKLLREQTGVEWFCTCGAGGVRDAQKLASESASSHRAQS